jgi:hypothetical protein
MSLLEMCEWLENTQIGTGIRESLWVFPIIESTHVLALAVSVGAILWFDLRTLGVNMRGYSISRVYRQVQPLMMVGFFFMFLTGILLFWAHAVQSYNNVFFRFKLAAMIMAGINAAYYHFKTQRGIAEWDKSPVPPRSVRVAGLLSLIFWAGVVASGRLMAYTF